MWGMSVKNKKIWDWIVWIQEKYVFVNMWLVKNYQTFYEIKKFYFTLCIYKMYLISTEGYENVGVHFFKSKKNWQNLGKHGKRTRWIGY